MSQPGLTYFEPTFGDELDVIMSWAFKHMQKPAGEGGAVYLRLSTRPLQQIDREMTPDLREAVIQGAYWVNSLSPNENTKLCLAYTGCIYPEIIQVQFSSLFSPLSSFFSQLSSFLSLLSNHSFTCSYRHIKSLSMKSEVATRTRLLSCKSRALIYYIRTATKKC